MSQPARQVAAAPDLGSLEAITQAVEGGLGLLEVARRGLRAGRLLVLIDRSSGVLAVAARSSADERSLMADAAGVETHELRGGGQRRRPLAPARLLRRRAARRAAARRHHADRLRGRAPARARARLRGRPERLPQGRAPPRRPTAATSSPCGEELGIDLAHGGAVIVVRQHHLAPSDDDWRARARRRRARRLHERARLARRRDRDGRRQRRPGRRALRPRRRTTVCAASPR